VQLCPNSDASDFSSASGAGSRASSDCTGYFGWGTIRRYGFGAFHPPGYFFLASSFETLPLMMTSSPGFQFTGVETGCLAVSCHESFHQYLCGSKRTEDASEVHTPWVRNKISPFSSRSMLP
jgi:hypothetical protein